MRLSNSVVVRRRGGGVIGLVFTVENERAEIEWRRDLELVASLTYRRRRDIVEFKAPEIISRKWEFGLV